MLRLRLLNTPWARLNLAAVAAGVLYCSWPLGYWLNPGVSKHGLASALEALHQPYNWVFTASDVMSSLLVLVISYLLWRKLLISSHGRLLIALLMGVIIFALGTIADTLLPEHCPSGLAGCPNWQQDHLLLAHGIFSIVASIGLFAALAMVWWQNRLSILLNSLMISYVVFGIASLIEMLTTVQSNWSQHYYITLCGVWLALLPYVLRRFFATRKQNKS